MTGVAREAIEAVWRIESARVVGGLARLVRDLSLAEDLAQDALLVALERWPEDGIPANPGAWLVTAAKNRAIDHVRHREMAAQKHGVLLGEAATVDRPSFEETLDEDVGDDVLRLVLIACHRVLSTEARVALTLRLVAGLTTDEIARAFLVPTATIAQRIVRAKRVLSEARVPFEIPRGTALAESLPSVLEVIYLVFNEGYSASHGDAWIRTELCEDALRLGRILGGLVPHEPEVHALVALMELHASRARARLDGDGEPILLLDQDRARWDRLLIGRGLAALARAQELLQHRREPLGPYALQAAIVACHARASSADLTDWPKIVALYDALLELTRSPVVALNRAVAVSMAWGPDAGLELVDALDGEGDLAGYHLLPSVRAELLTRLGRHAEARAEYERAAELAPSDRDRRLLRARAQLVRAPSA